MQLFRNIKLKEQFTRLRFGGRDKVGDREAYVLNAGTADNRRERLYFDAENGLLLRRVTFTQTIIGVIPEQIDFEDYRDVEGVKLPFAIRVSSVDPGNPISTRKFDEIKLNAPIDDSKFNMPPKPRLLKSRPFLRFEQDKWSNDVSGPKANPVRRLRALISSHALSRLFAATSLIGRALCAVQLMRLLEARRNAETAGVSAKLSRAIALLFCLGSCFSVTAIHGQDLSKFDLSTNDGVNAAREAIAGKPLDDRSKLCIAGTKPFLELRLWWLRIRLWLPFARRLHKLTTLDVGGQGVFKNCARGAGLESRSISTQKDSASLGGKGTVGISYCHFG
jgi:hypothetical protein